MREQMHGFGLLLQDKHPFEKIEKSHSFVCFSRVSVSWLSLFMLSVEPWEWKTSMWCLVPAIEREFFFCLLALLLAFVWFRIFLPSCWNNQAADKACQLACLNRDKEMLYVCVFFFFSFFAPNNICALQSICKSIKVESQKEVSRVCSLISCLDHFS